jgi:hypothetical protein
MSPQSVPRPQPAPKVLTAKQMPKRLPLANMTVIRRVADEDEARITAPELARLIAGTQPEGWRAPLVSRQAVADELACLSDLVNVIGVADHADEGYPLDAALFWVAESLKRLSQRVVALHFEPTDFVVEVTR